MKKLISVIALIVMLVCLLASCKDAITKDDLLDGKTAKDLYHSAIKNYNNHKVEGIPFSMNIVWSQSSGNSDVVIDLIYAGNNLKFSMTENAITEEITFHEGVMYYKGQNGEKLSFETDYSSVEKYLNEYSDFESFVPALPENIPSSWFDNLDLVPSEDGKYFTVVAEPKKGGQNPPLYEEFYQSGVICKLYFTLEGVLEKVELDNVTIAGEKGNIILTISWDESIKVNAPFDKDDFGFNGGFNPDNGDKPGDDNKVPGSGDDKEQQYSTGLWFYLNDDKTYYIVGGMEDCTDVNIKIPPTYNGLSVKAIREKAFASYEIESVILPEGIESIGMYAFAHCSSLRSITIPQSVTTIGDGALLSCISLKSVTLPKNLEKISSELFDGCESLESIIIPDGVTSIGWYAFSGCTSLVAVEISNSVTSIGYSAFENCTSLVAVEIPNSVTSIDYSAFENCTSLVAVEIPNSVTSIGWDAFSGCTSLKSIVLTTSIRDISDDAFDDCISLEYIYYLGTEKEWNRLQFRLGDNEIVNKNIVYYHSETQPTVEGNFWHYVDGVPTPWGEYVSPSNPDIGGSGSDPHVHNYEYTRIVEPTCMSEGYTVHSCSCGAAYGDTFVDAIGHSFNDGYCIRCGEWDPSYTYSEGLQYSIDKDYTYYSIVGIGTCTDTEIIIPPTYCGLPVKRISGSAFSDCDFITSVILGSNIESVYINSFANCTSLKSIVISKSVRSIKDAFSGCTALSEIHIVDIGAWCEMSLYDYDYVLSKADLYLDGKLLTDVVIPEGVTSINSNAFSGRTSITSIVIPNSVTSISKSTFSNCTSLTSVVLGNGLTNINGFSGCTSLESIIIPDSAISIDNGAFSNCTSLTSVVLGNGLTNINGFSGCTSLESIIIPDSAISIDNGAFSNCTSLKSVVFGKGLTSISGFDGCTSLESVTIPEGVTSIGIFTGCTSLTSLIIPDSVTSINKASFSNCTSLKSIVFGKGLTSISGFAGCTSLESVTIPEGVTSIGSFAGCTSLESIVIPNSVTSIGSFAGCTSLESVIIPDGVTSIGSNAFSNCTALKDVIIGNGVTKIGIYAFSGCTSLESIVIPDSVTTITGQAFYECTSLVSVVISKNLTSLSHGVFSGCASLEKIYCTSTKSEDINAETYKNMLIGTGSKPPTFYRYYSETAPTEEGNFWHYVDGVPTPW